MPAPDDARAGRPGARRRGATLLRIGVAAVMAAAGGAHAQGLLELYDAARAFDATYLAARAQAESVPYRVEQTEALLRPSASLGSNLTRTETNAAFLPNYGSNGVGVSVNGRQPIFNRA